MKILLAFISLTMLSSVLKAQCNTTEDANNTPTSCKRGYGNNHLYMGSGKQNMATTKQAEKWLVDVYNNVVNDAIKKTTGLRGDWNASVFEATPEGLVPSNIQMYMGELGCTKDHKLYEKHESGIVVNVSLNSIAKIGKTCNHEEKTLVNKKDIVTNVMETVGGRQVYMLAQQTASDKSGNYAYYKKDKEGTYFIIAKPGVPLFLPVSIKDVLLINRARLVAERNFKNSSYDAILNQTLEEYLVAVDYADFKTRFSKKEADDAYKFFSDGYYSNKKKTAKMKADDFSGGLINDIDTYLQKTPAAQLTRPCISNFFGDGRPIGNGDFKESTADGQQYVTLNPAYINHKTAVGAPQFLQIEIRVQVANAVGLKAAKNFENNLDGKKMIQMLQNL